MQRFKWLVILAMLVVFSLNGIVIAQDDEGSTVNITLNSEIPYVPFELNGNGPVDTANITFAEDGIALFCNDNGDMPSLEIGGDFDWNEIVREILPLVECPDSFPVNEGENLTLSTRFDDELEMFVILIPNSVLSTLNAVPNLSSETPILRRILNPDEDGDVSFTFEAPEDSTLVLIIVGDRDETTGVWYALDSIPGDEEHYLCTPDKSCVHINNVEGNSTLYIEVNDPMFGDAKTAEVIAILLPPPAGLDLPNFLPTVAPTTTP